MRNKKISNILIGVWSWPCGARRLGVCDSRKSAILRQPQVGKKREFWGRLGAAASGKKQKNQQLKNRLAADASRKMDERVYFE